MDVVVLAIAVIAALLLSRGRAVALVAVAWLFALSMVAWGPAHSSSVHVGSPGFWAPWIIVLTISAGLVFGIQAVKRRRSTRRSASRA